MVWLLAWMLLLPSDGTGGLAGRLVDASGSAVGGAEVSVRPVAGGPERTTVTRADGSFEVEDLPAPASYQVTATLARGIARAEVAVAPGQRAVLDLVARPGFREEVTVSESREERLKRETPASVSTLGREQIESVRPTHPGQLMGLVPGVWVNTTGGEGHQTAIRQPLTTNPVYLFLEDGIPSRSTGFFNHNALYEINVPAAEAVEVTRGPGSALYGSDAVGGVVNVLTRSALAPPGIGLTLDAGEHGFARALLDGGARRGRQGLRGELNLTRTDGWRDATGYDRRSARLRYDRASGADHAVKAVVTYSRIDQQTAGASGLGPDDYRERPTLNLTPISFREVEAFRASADITFRAGAARLSVVPYARYDRMDLMPNWTLTFDPHVSYSSNRSLGVLAKSRWDVFALRGRVLAGVDLDVSPGRRRERSIAATTAAIGAARPAFVGYEEQATIYDYRVTYVGAAPYVAVESSPLPRVGVSVGLRADHMTYDYDDRLDTPAATRHRRPADARPSFSRLSPKLGITWAPRPAVSAFASWRHAFRAPSEGQLFRQGSALDSIGLAPVKARSAEVGLRAAGERYSVEAAVYQLDKRDDILGFRDPEDGATRSVNAGRTRHRGVELGASARPAPWIQLTASWTWVRHTYVDWSVDPARGEVFDGLEMEQAPRTIGSAVVDWTPRTGTTLSLEASHVRRYWMDPANTHAYSGHTLVNVRARHVLRRGVEAFARVLNAGDRRFAEVASFTAARGEELAPGLPRTVYGGLALRWNR